MLLSPSAQNLTNSLTDELFYLNFNHKLTSTDILIKFNTKELNTKNMPKTIELLKNHLPSILTCKCYNPENFPFIKEAEQTELGHLFEHIMLEYLSEESVSIYQKRRIFRGVTTWDWTKEEKGLFRVSITIPQSDQAIFMAALQKSVVLLKKILLSN